MGLWRGPLLEGFDLPHCPEFEDWLAMERQQAESLYIEALAELCERCAGAGAHEEALLAAEALVRADPLREDGHRWIMALRARAGHRGAALRQYALARDLLQRELGVSVARETEELRERIIRGELPTASGSASSAPAIPPAPAVAAALRRLTVELPLVGRDGPLARLGRYLQEAREGRGTVALISGESGIGKSRLVAEVLAMADGECASLAAACRSSFPETCPLAFQPAWLRYLSAASPA